MKRAVLAIICYSLLTSPHSASADEVFDLDMASRYLRAAQSGDNDAQFYLGALYSTGVGVPRSDQEAFSWFSRAANQGHSHAMLILAGLYATGRGIAKNNVEAYKWSSIVNNLSRVDEFRDSSSQLMGVLEKRMSPDEVSKAKSDAAKWRATATSRPAPTAPPAADYSRASPVVPAPTVTGEAPVPPSAAPASTVTAVAPPAQPSKSSNDNPPLDAFGKNISKDDVDDFIREMPKLRKKFGF
jgi:Sel1 repeat-containing protein